PTQIHRANHRLDERDLVFAEAVLGVQVLVGPGAVPFLCWHERVDLASGVVRWLVQENQEASQPTGEVGQDARCLTLGVERAYAEIRLRRDAPRLPDERCADDPVRVGVLVSGTWR